MDIWYGLLVCLLVILYYQSDFVEGMSGMINPYLLNPIDNQWTLSSPSILLAKPLFQPAPSIKPKEEWDIFDWISPSPQEAIPYEIGA